MYVSHPVIVSNFINGTVAHQAPVHEVFQATILEWATQCCQENHTNRRASWGLVERGVAKSRKGLRD